MGRGTQTGSDATRGRPGCWRSRLGWSGGPEVYEEEYKEVYERTFAALMRLSRSIVGKTFARVLRKARLPGHFTPHSLRHSFASILLQRGVSPVYVQRSLGHANIRLTVDVYGRWLPHGDKSVVDALDRPGRALPRPAEG